MSITAILANKDADASEKLAEVAKAVAATRKAYGNTDAEIEAPKVTTPYGNVTFDALEDDSKVELLQSEALKIKAQVTEAAAQNSAVVVAKEVEKRIAISPFFANIEGSADYGVL